LQRSGAIVFSTTALCVARRFHQHAAPGKLPGRRLHAQSRAQVGFRSFFGARKDVGSFEAARGNEPADLAGQQNAHQPGQHVAPESGSVDVGRHPTARGVKAHSIVAIDGKENPPEGGDGVVKYTSAHVDYVESELVVRSFHSCQDKPPTIEELRRILHLHLEQLK
jgi:hypothetical protein